MEPPALGRDRSKLRRFGGSLWFLVLLALAGVLVVITALPKSNTETGPGTLIVASLPFWNLGNGTSTVVNHREDVNEVSPWMYGLDANGGLTDQYTSDRRGEVAEHVQRLRESGVPLVPSLANITDGKWSYDPVARMLHDPARTQRHVAEIVELVKREDYAGIDIDYENLRAVDRQPFARFVTDLGNALHAEGKTLSVAVFAKESDPGYDERNLAQDYAAIGRAVDQVRLMAYDRHWATSPPGPVAPISWVRDVLQYAKTQLPPEKIVLGVPLYGYDWSDGRATSVTWLQAFQLSTAHRVEPQYDNQSQAPWFRYTDERGRPHEVWFENAVSSKAKFEAAHGSGIRGVYLWMYGYEDMDTWSKLRQSLPLAD